MKNLLSLVTFVTLAMLFACTKESLTVTDVYTDTAAVSLTDRDGGKAGKHPGFRHHHGDSTHVFDSTHVHSHDSIHVHDSTHVHPNDSTHVHPHDTIQPGGGHHGNGGGNGCHVPPAVIAVTDLPQAAQDWLAANPPAAAIESVVRRTKVDCTVTYTVKLADGTKIRFDADGNKI